MVAAMATVSDAAPFHRGGRSPAPSWPEDEKVSWKPWSRSAVFIYSVFTHIYI
jgi:hypothetical protein